MPINGNKIRELRDKKKWSQEHLADLVGLDARQTIGEIEKGGSVKVDTLEKIANALGVDIFELWIVPKGKKTDYRIEDIVGLLKDDPQAVEPVFHLLEAKKNFDRASSSMKQYVGKKLEAWFEFAGGPDGKEDKDKGENDP